MTPEMRKRLALVFPGLSTSVTGVAAGALRPETPAITSVTPVTPRKRQDRKGGKRSLERRNGGRNRDPRRRGGRNRRARGARFRGLPGTLCRHLRAPEPSKADHGFGRAMVASPRRRGPVPRRLGSRSGGNALERGRVVRPTARGPTRRHRLAVEGRKGRRLGRGSCSPE